MTDRLLVLIAGPSGSGKSSLARSLETSLEAFGYSCVALSADNYYRDLSHLTRDERAQHNFDRPDAWEHELLETHAEQLKKGGAINMPFYDFNTHSRHKTTKAIEARDVIIFEGLFTLCHAGLRDLADLRIFSDVDNATARQRRIRRDTKQRGRDRDSIIQQYESTVSPANRLYVRPSATYADLVVSGKSPLPEQTETIMREIKKRHPSPTAGNPSPKGAAKP